MQPKYLFIDFETRSTVDLREKGLSRYVESEHTRPWCLGFAFDDENVEVLELINESWCGCAIESYVLSGDPVVAHNAAFELAIWNDIMVPRYGWPPLRPSQTICTMAMAYAMALPGALEAAAHAVGLAVEKDMVGHRLMLQMAGPRMTEPFLTWWDAPDKIERLHKYCAVDVDVERQLFKRLRLLPGA